MTLNDLLPLIAGENYIIHDQYGDPQDAHDVADWDVLKVLPRLRENEEDYYARTDAVLLVIVRDEDAKNDEHDDDFFNSI